MNDILLSLITAIIGFILGCISSWFKFHLDLKKLKAEYELSNKDKFQGQQYEADKKILEKLWRLISSKNIERLDNDTQNGYIARDWYHNNIRRYFEIAKKPENRLINPDLEVAFQTFNKSLYEYHEKMVVAYTTQTNELTQHQPMLVTHRKSIHWTDRPFSAENLHFLEQQYEKVVDAVLLVREKHENLVEAIKRIMPDFDFDI